MVDLHKKLLSSLHIFCPFQGVVFNVAEHFVVKRNHFGHFLEVVDHFVQRPVDSLQLSVLVHRFGRLLHLTLLLFLAGGSLLIPELTPRHSAVEATQGGRRTRELLLRERGLLVAVFFVNEEQIPLLLLQNSHDSLHENGLDRGEGPFLLGVDFELVLFDFLLDEFRVNQHLFPLLFVEDLGISLLQDRDLQSQLLNFLHESGFLLERVLLVNHRTSPINTFVQPTGFFVRARIRSDSARLQS